MRFAKWIIGVGMTLSLPITAWAVDLGTSGLTNAGTNAGVNTAGVEGSLGSLIGLVINVVLSILGVLLFIYFVYAGFLWMTAQGDEKRVKQARDIMKNALAGLIIIFLALSIVTFIAGQFSMGRNLGTSTTIYQNAVTGAGFTAADADLAQNIGSMIAIVLNALGVVLLAIFLYAGFLWMTAAGDSKQTQKAKDMMRNAVVGLIIVLSARILAVFVIDRLVGDEGVFGAFVPGVIHNTKA
jgi:cytochrome bd-type quinol oxidase subunit 2